jgi:hypothetical protein
MCAVNNITDSQAVTATPSGIPHFKPAKSRSVKAKLRTKHRVSAKSLANLKQEKGFTGNPGGRPKTATFRLAALEWLAADPKRRIRILEKLAKTKPEFFVQLVDGKLTDTVTLQNADGSNLIPKELIAAAVAVSKQL